MLTILVANVKGGCGKTTVATNLAAAFAGGGLITRLVDLDRQHSSRDWACRRPDDKPAVPVIDAAKADWTKTGLRKALADAGTGVQRLVIDAPAALRVRQIEALVDLADVILLPVLPSAFDESATERFLERIEELKAVKKKRTTLALVGNRVRERTRAAKQLEDWCQATGHPVVTRLRDSALYTDAALDGLALFDLPGKRSAEAREDWRPLIRFIEEHA